MHQHENCNCGHEHAEQHAHACACGSDHAHHGHGEHHENKDACGCRNQQDHGHHHAHGEACACGCGHTHAQAKPIDGLSALQEDFLLALCQRQYLPIASFELAKADDDAVRMLALAPIYLGTPQDTMEQVRALGVELIALEEGGLITLDYDLPLQNYPYTEYETSALYAFFKQTVAEAAKQPNFVFDTPVLSLGSMTLTDAGHDTVREMIS